MDSDRREIRAARQLLFRVTRRKKKKREKREDERLSLREWLAITEIKISTESPRLMTRLSKFEINCDKIANAPKQFLDGETSFFFLTLLFFLSCLASVINSKHV